MPPEETRCLFAYAMANEAVDAATLPVSTNGRYDLTEEQLLAVIADAVCRAEAELY